MKKAKRRRGIATIADLKANSIVDPVTHCWHWQGAKNKKGSPMIWTFDHDKGDKMTLPGPSAVWNIAHGESPKPMLAYRHCFCADCVNPAHHRRARDRAELGRMVRLTGALIGINSELRRINSRIGRIKAGFNETPIEIVKAIRAAPKSTTGRDLARLHNIGEQVVSRIRRGESYKWVEA